MTKEINKLIQVTSALVGEVRRQEVNGEEDIAAELERLAQQTERIASRLQGLMNRYGAKIG